MAGACHILAPVSSRGATAAGRTTQGLRPRGFAGITVLGKGRATPCEQLSGIEWCGKPRGSRQGRTPMAIRWYSSFPLTTNILVRRVGLGQQRHVLLTCGAAQRRPLRQVLFYAGMFIQRP